MRDRNQDYEDNLHDMLKEWHLEVFQQLKIEGLMTEKIEADFVEFLAILEDEYSKHGGKFSMDYVYKRLSHNSWRSLYRKRLEEKLAGETPSDRLARGKALVEKMEKTRDSSNQH